MKLKLHNKWILRSLLIGCHLLLLLNRAKIMIGK